MGLCVVHDRLQVLILLFLLFNSVFVQCIFQLPETLIYISISRG